MTEYTYSLSLKKADEKYEVQVYETPHTQKTLHHKVIKMMFSLCMFSNSQSIHPEYFDLWLVHDHKNMRTFVMSEGVELDIDQSLNGIGCKVKHFSLGRDHHYVIDWQYKDTVIFPELSSDSKQVLLSGEL